MGLCQNLERQRRPIVSLRTQKAVRASTQGISPCMQGGSGGISKPLLRPCTSFSQIAHIESFGRRISQIAHIDRAKQAKQVKQSDESEQAREAHILKSCEANKKPTVNWDAMHRTCFAIKDILIPCMLEIDLLSNREIDLFTSGLREIP
jgi:hypothetical protein